MLEFQCHYREEKWPTGEYFDYVEYFFKMANASREDEDCESPPCPTLEVTTTTSYSTKGTDISFLLVILHTLSIKTHIQHYLATY